MKKRVLIYVISALIVLGLVGGSVYYYRTHNDKVSTTQEKAGPTTQLSYEGKDGMTALELLQKNADVKTSGTGKDAFVTSVNGTAANPKSQYWAFFVNDETATIGAGSYVTKNGDKITWKLTTF